MLKCLPLLISQDRDSTFGSVPAILEQFSVNCPEQILTGDELGLRWTASDPAIAHFARSRSLPNVLLLANCRSDPQ
ncbi:hypothetical protein M413DRAFT_440342 [Hebeloma cylindrosporum]|uniref:Uncharacterized protein n=1 Tax=Hebeloma cylindrosporum TaxID=76867 RepID=A0A0C2YAB1_HEBCY|nr:hypothetical protein M413DRAFT_440342 [Hebeloma cylindrosporum h7]